MNPDRRLRALNSLHGLALGDALGSQFFVPDNRPHLTARTEPPGPWQWTDDAEMACSVFAELDRHGRVDQDHLAASFAQHHDFDRGYGPAVNRMLRLIRTGESWRSLAPALFDGAGSWGNGAAMRVAPLGAWFADDLALAASEAALSATVTHTHPEAVAGAVAVAVAAAVAARGTDDLLAEVLPHIPPSALRDAVDHARTVSTGAAEQLGNGRHTSALDTVPFALWVAAHHPDDYAAAFWTTATAGGDVDTTCAIVGGIVAAPPPPHWLAKCEPLPAWAGV
ncbi:ADP-ribosylglycohydrolase family protein [Actinokineospora diospyrosa]|uniref:ADP-ribosylglycohydrolase n=1 Tax=Actinokineospora diospyrosa TaxID=103728 RepID=A0ABT1I7N8_9PSEU|nr:ADP-ribosylglycohydrolase family protein [Actinokineospora diospyrosa]MCP2268628.1 ADP-ribosylglycohydrolase [Actinokineospora diospyrosa]